jgi:hypothetical protein
MLDAVDTLLVALGDLQPAVLYLLTGLFMTLETTLLIGLVLPGDSVVLLAGTTVTGPARFGALVAVATFGSPARRVDRLPARPALRGPGPRQPPRGAAGEPFPRPGPAGRISPKSS